MSKYGLKDGWACVPRVCTSNKSIRPIRGPNSRRPSEHFKADLEDFLGQIAVVLDCPQEFFQVKNSSIPTLSNAPSLVMIYRRSETLTGLFYYMRV